jgi:menaquinone-dependent protoporphyrinogen oxidase
MADSVLVAYATRYGATQEVAEVVAATLREQGLAVDLQPARKVQTLEGYAAVVLGAPLYIGSWQKDARSFLKRHHAALIQRPLALFTLGPTEDKEEDWKEVRGQLDQQLAKYPWLTPVACELFGGKLDPAQLRFPDSLLTKLPASPLHDMPASDIRDWAAIRAWAAGLVTLLQAGRSG